MLQNYKLKLIVSYLVIVLVDQGLADEVVVKIRDGPVKGRQTVTFYNKTYYSFQKIPYAAPPIGKLRLKDPVNPQKWDEILDVSANINVKCHQYNTDEGESEDCLYINIFTPKLPVGDNNPSYSILVFTHGGSFVDESSAFSEYGPQFFIDEDIIVVTLNYRLGLFGFLSTGDEIIPGNFALKDQLFAIKWVKENAQYFGGDPNKITIVGQSAGASLTSYQLLHTESEGLFRAAIIESASALSPFAMQRYPKVIANKVAASVNSSFEDFDDSTKILELLQGVSEEELDKVNAEVYAWAKAMLGNISLPFAPVIEVEHEGAFITEKMYAKLKAGNFIKVPLLAGFNSLEAVGSAANLEKFKETMKSYDDNLNWLVPQDMLVEDEGKLKEMGAKIRDIYTNGKRLQDYLIGGVRYIGDNRYTRPVRKFSELYSKFAPVYFYQFTYDGLMGNKNITVDGVTGVAHHEECYYLWHTHQGSFDNGKLDRYPESDILTLKRMTRMWTNFIKYLNPTPNPEDLLQKVTWPVATSGADGDFLFLHIMDDLDVRSNPKDESFSAWQSLYDTLGHEDFDTW